MALQGTDREQGSAMSDKGGKEAACAQQTAQDIGGRTDAGQSDKGPHMPMDLPFWDECFSTSPLYSKPIADWNKKGRNVSRPEGRARATRPPLAGTRVPVRAGACSPPAGRAHVCAPRPCCPRGSVPGKTPAPRGRGRGPHPTVCRLGGV